MTKQEVEAKRHAELEAVLTKWQAKLEADYPPRIFYQTYANRGAEIEAVNAKWDAIAKKEKEAWR